MSHRHARKSSGLACGDRRDASMIHASATVAHGARFDGHLGPGGADPGPTMGLRSPRESHRRPRGAHGVPFRAHVAPYDVHRVRSDATLWLRDAHFARHEATSPRSCETRAASDGMARATHAARSASGRRGAPTDATTWRRHRPRPSCHRPRRPSDGLCADRWDSCAGSPCFPADMSSSRAPYARVITALHAPRTTPRCRVARLAP